ncbi:hypothetical protein A3L12_05105 [Thermococcus sp. P6]|uniref:DUF167 domain-containing protein n=1 Tax=Thermococcus sp. P6 TaxID=122420 RepID=UPI000B59C115|nr:DUF167 domain-containing protein [Thermococcus sp. P6]ASJ10718.1 hypothetical protein A3L12_05105 [Thermococcus sp. P6]
MSAFIKETGDGVILRVYVQPKAKENRIEGIDEWRGRLKVRIKAPPVEGKANRELVKFLSGLLDAKVSIVRGETGREKDLLVVGIGKEEVMKRLGI